MTQINFCPTKHLGWLFILGSAIYLYGGLFTAYPLYTHETPMLYYRVFEYHLELSQNGFPAQLFPSVMQQGGFAFPMYYPPFSYLLATAIYVIVRSYFFAVHMALFLSIFASSLSVYYCFKQYFGVAAALAAAVAYMVFPYRFVEIFVRGALAEAWSFFWFPLVFSGGLALVHKKWYAVLLLSLSISGLLMTHSVVGMYFLTSMLLLFTASSLYVKRASAAIPAIFALALAIGMAAWYIFPQQLSWDLVKATEPSHMIATPERAAEQKPDWSQLFFSNPAIWNDTEVRATYPGVLRDGMSFEMGFPYFLIFIFIIVTRTTGHLKDPMSRSMFWGTIAILTLTVIYMGLPLPFLKVLPAQFSFIQFPWRCLGLTCFFAAILLAYSFYALPWHDKQKLLFSLGCSVLMVSSVNPIFKVPVYDAKAKDEVNKSVVIVEGNTGLVPASEYLPRDYERDNLTQLANRQLIARGQVEITNINRDESYLSFAVNALEPGEVILPLIDYPVWEAWTNAGQRINLAAEKGLIKATLPIGQYEVQLTRVFAPGQVGGLVASMISLLLLAAYSIVARKRAKQKRDSDRIES